MRNKEIQEAIEELEIKKHCAECSDCTSAIVEVKDIDVILRYMEELEKRDKFTDKFTDKFKELEKELKRWKSITDDVTIYCRGWAYDNVKKVVDLAGYPDTEIIMHDMLPEEHIAVIVDNRFRRTL